MRDRRGDTTNVTCNRASVRSGDACEKMALPVGTLH
jgi:hypothetical protein